MKGTAINIIAMAMALAFTACSSGGDGEGGGGKGNDIANYKTKQIGDQVWMAENLDYAVAGSVCYDGDTANCARYGRLYDWETANRVCPSGWHLPSRHEWNALINFVESDKGCSDCDAKHLKAKSGWNDNGNGLDSYDFAALPGGLGHSDGSFGGAGKVGHWWSSSELIRDYAYFRSMSYDDESADWNWYDNSNLLSVRCVRTEAP